MIAHVFRRPPELMMKNIVTRLRYLLGNNWEHLRTMNELEFKYPSLHFVFYFRFAADVSVSLTCFLPH